MIQPIFAMISKCESNSALGKIGGVLVGKEAPFVDVESILPTKLKGVARRLSTI